MEGGDRLWFVKSANSTRWLGFNNTFSDLSKECPELKYGESNVLEELLLRQNAAGWAVSETFNISRYKINKNIKTIRQHLVFAHAIAVHLNNKSGD